MQRLRLFRGLIAELKKALEPSSQAPLCFYLEGQPFLDEPYYFSTPELGEVCLLNGVSFATDDNLGTQISIEDRPGLAAAVQAVTLQESEQSEPGAVPPSKWRLYRAGANVRIPD
ncbi:MAG TPA: hypothetical protein VEQ35_09105 [Beijerinckia sp.]|jgi:hypothetical protein|nr:hypothetical protein [Beijerinckia sp.]